VIGRGKTSLYKRKALKKTKRTVQGTLLKLNGKKTKTTKTNTNPQKKTNTTESATRSFNRQDLGTRRAATNQAHPNSEKRGEKNRLQKRSTKPRPLTRGSKEEGEKKRNERQNEEKEEDQKRVKRRRETRLLPKRKKERRHRGLASGGDEAHSFATDRKHVFPNETRRRKMEAAQESIGTTQY